MSTNELAIFDSRDTQIAELKAEVRRLSREVTEARADAESAHRETARALTELRRQLSPLYRALQMVFGELDAVGVDDVHHAAAPPSAGNPRTSAVWESWKSRMQGAPAKVIDALLLHQDMNQQQLCIATGIPRGSMTNVISRLNKAGLLNKNGGRISLKQL